MWFRISWLVLWKRKKKTKETLLCGLVICAISFLIVGRSFCGCLTLFSHEVLCWTGKKWNELVVTGGKWFDFKFMLLQWAGLQFIPAISFAVIFRKSAKNFENLFHLLIYALLCQGMRKPATFSKLLVWTRQAREPRVKFDVETCVQCRTAINIPWIFLFFFAAEFVMVSVFVAVAENKDSATTLL